MTVSMFDRLFETPALYALERALDACSLRGQLIANNIANADTPNYKAKRLAFENILARQLGMDEGSSGRLSLLRTDPRHLSGLRSRISGSVSFPQVEVYTEENMTFRLDGNSVDIDRESAEQAKNALQYAVLTELASRRLSGLRTVITGGKR